MGDCYIELPFVTASQMKFPRGSYIIHENRRFEIMDRVRPDFDAKTGGYKYSLKFWSQQNHMKRRKVFWLQGANREVTFHNTTTLDQFGQLIVDNMNTFLGGENWVLGGIPADLADTSKLISFNGDFCWDAVNTIAEIFGVEWWTEENGAQVALYFGKLEFGTPEEFKRGDVVTSIPASKGDDSSYGTRFYVFGSTRNLPKDYNNTEHGGVTNHVSEVRLQLPEGIPYIDAKENLAPQDIVEQVVFFEDVFPKNTDVVTAVTTVERAVEGAEEDQQKTFTAYQVVAENTPFVPSDVYEGETLMIRFESGSLSGMEFEVDLRDDNDNRIDPATWKPEDGFNKKFEIVATTEYSGDSLITIPGNSLIPAAEDKFILTGVKLAQERITEARNELLNVGKAYAAKNSSDTEVYNCPTNPVYCATNDKNYEAGQKVALVDSRFEDGVRYSRIQGYEKKLWNPYIATYTVGDNSAYTRIGQIETSIQESAYAERIGVVKGVGIYVIRSKYDQTSPTDYNVYSALAVEALFLNKTKDQIVHGNVEFKKPVVGTLQSKNYRAGGFAGTGFKLGYDANGDSIIEADNLVIRKEAKFSTVTINQISFTFGETVFSNGGAEITVVEELDDRYRCYYDTKNGTRYAGIQTDDQVRCQYYSANLSKAKYYWRLCVGVSNEDGYFDLSKTDKNGNGIPEVGDNAVQFGNRTNKTRQSAIVIDPLNGGSVWVYANINSYNLDNNLFVGIGTIAESQQAFLYGYGAAYIGDRDEASYISYDPDTKKVKIKGELIVGSGSSGLANFSEWASKQSQIDKANTNATKAQKTANEAKTSAANALAEAKSYADAIKDELQDQLDGKVESFFKDYDPTLKNEPASSWTTDELKAVHLNDTFTNTETGKSWRWLFKNGAYQWVPITDTQAAEALAAAMKAQDTADGKRRTFVFDTPKGPYDIGDLWITRERIKVCSTASEVSDHYNPDDWVDADNYYEYSDEKSSETERKAKEYTNQKAQEAAKALQVFIEGDFADDIEDIKGQIDGKAETFYEGSDPSTSWDSDELKEQHKGDLWYTKGRSYTWNGSAWVESNVPESVYDKIDGKSAIYVARPTNYRMRDMWVLDYDYTDESGNSGFKQGVVVFAKKSKDNSFSWDDWDLKVSYTDDTAADKAQETAKKAAQAAADAKGVADAAKKRMDGWIADGVITRFELLAIEEEYRFINADYSSITKQVDVYPLPDEDIYNDFDEAYENYNDELNGVTDYFYEDAKRETMAVPTDFFLRQREYYDNRTLILNALADATRAAIDDYSYLKNALDKTDSNEGTVIDNGLILSSIIGVRRNEKVVAAMMNAENINNQTDVPYFAAGIKDIQDIAGSSRFLVSYDGKVQVQDNEVAEATRRKVIMDFGALRYFNGETVALEQIPDEYKATPTDDMVFGNLTKDNVRDETYTFTNNIIIDPPADGTKAKRSLVSFDVGAGYDEILIAGGDFSSIGVMNGTTNNYKVQLSLVVGGTAIWEGPELSIKTQISSGIPQEQRLMIGSTVSSRDDLKGKVVKLEMSVWKTSGTSLGMVSFSFGSKNTVVVKGNVSTSAYANRLFGNGFFFAKTAENYCGVIVDGDNGAVAEMRNGKQGFRFTAEGPQKYHADFGWIPIDGVIARGTVTYSASWSTPSINILSSVFKSLIRVTTVGNRTIVTMPSNENLTTSNWVVTVNGEKQYSSSSTTLGVFASVVARSANQFTVYTGANNSAICGNFSFEIKAI